MLRTGGQCSGDLHGGVRAAGSCAGGRRRNQPLPRLPRHCRPPSRALRAPTPSTPPLSSQANDCSDVLIRVVYYVQYLCYYKFITMITLYIARIDCILSMYTELERVIINNRGCDSAAEQLIL